MKKIGRNPPFPLVWIFVMAVLLPCTALSFLALRSADRESAYAERRFESSLAAEAGLAAQRADEVMREIARALEGSVSRAALARGSEENPIIGTPFELRGGEVIFPGTASEAEREEFLRTFGDFLQYGSTLPVYDSVTKIYRSDFGADVGDYADKSVPAAQNLSEQAEPKTLRGVQRQRAGSMIAADSDVMNEALSQASSEGFEIATRNVAPTAEIAKKPRPFPVQQVPAPAQEALVSEMPSAPEQLSLTVSRRRTFAEVTSRADSGLVPRLTDDGLAILFWAKRGENGEPSVIEGCSLNMLALRDHIAEALPDVLTDVRVLSVLDENGKPIVDVESLPALDWRKPYIAREISPALPRWEAGVWLIDPGALAQRARLTGIAVSLLVSALFVVIAAGSALVLRTITIETRTAAQKTTFVANVTHELKTPLTSIRLFSELLLSGKQSDLDRRREYLRTIASEAGRLSRLVDDILAISSRGRSYAMSPLDLADLAKDVLSRLEPGLAASGFTVTLDAPAPVPAKGDSEALEQVLTNMLSNAEKYSGDVREISVMAKRNGKTAELCVMDRGIGVAPGISGKIFQEFFRGDDSLSAARSGAGLGLAIARGIAQKHGGDMSYAPRDGGGSVFTLSLPLDAGQTT
ncbi:MAG: HAMP domain-containing histidine kinase [Synergistaceae bacterium]|jgi:signal transduction histidine kinase|nr:HAMP domain-containing histidine kinase [Synergistaceae bacterium]